MYLVEGSSFIILGVILYLSGRAIFIRINSNKIKQIYWLKELIILLFIVYIYMVISVTLFPIPIGYTMNFRSILSLVNIISLKSIIENINLVGVAYNGDIIFMVKLIMRNVLGNVLLLMPLGFFIPILWSRFRQLKRIVLLGFTLSVLIEFLQLLQSLIGGIGRVSDVDDVIFNVLGTIIGYYIYKLTFKLVEKYEIKIFQRIIMSSQ